MNVRAWSRRCGMLLGLAALLVVAAPSPQAGQSARPRIAFLYPGGESIGPAEIRRAARTLDVDLTLFAPGAEGDSLTLATDLSTFDLLLVDGSTTGLARHGAQLSAALARTRVVVVQPTPELEGNVPLSDHPWLAAYWAHPSQDNYVRLIRYLTSRVLDRPATEAIAPPIVYPAQGFYHPDAPALFASMNDYLAWYRTRSAPAGAHRYDANRSTIGVYFHLTTYQQKNHAQIDALVRAVERRGHNVAVLAFRSNARLDAFLVEGRPLIDVLIFSGTHMHVKDRDAGLEQARTLGVPHLGGMNHSGMTDAEFAASPTGLHPTLTAAVVDAEREGRFEPMVISGRGARVGDRFLIAPFDRQIEWRVDRALAWARLHRAPNADKRLLFTYWSQGGGKANVGGDPDDFLDVPATLVRLLGQLQARGYDVGSNPLPDRDALVRRMALEASNVGTWAPGELAARVARNHVALLPESTYKQWYDALPRVRRAEIEEMWGPPPGKVMVHTDGRGQRFLVIPTIAFGKMLIAPHPDWGYLQDQKALMSTGALPPHHQYLAFFLWMQKEWRADAWVSLFTNTSLQPGKAEGPAADEHIALLLGAMPHIHPERLGANGGVGNKRKVMAQTVGWYNIVAASETSEQYFELRARLTRYGAQPDAKLRAEAEPLIRSEVVRTGIDRALSLDAAQVRFDDLLPRVQGFLDEVDRALAPHGSKILGDAPTGKALADMVTAMAGRDLRASLEPLTATPAMAARALVAAVVLDGQEPRAALVAAHGASSAAAEAQLELARTFAARLRTAPRETAAILEVLEGRWIDPGPMDGPIRKPDALPPGRSLYNFDQGAIPTPEAEAIGVRLAEALITAHREKHDGAYPTKLAFVIWSGEIAKNLGVTEAQILHLLGTRPVRDARGTVTGVELIAREELGRPRVDVLATTSGTYRDHYQDKVELIAEATRLAAASPEPDNPVAAATRATEAALTANGETAERAAALARARVFSPAPGAYSPSIQFLAKSGDQRGDEARMAELYTDRLSHAYGAGLYGEAARPAFEQHLGRVDSATLPRTSHVNGLLDHPMSAGFLGGLNLAARAVTGNDIDLYVSNLRDPDNTSIEPAAQALQAELRTRYFNAAWLRQMQAHGYEGARNMMYLTDHLDLWDSTATRMVSSRDWDEVKDVYVEDTLGLGMEAFFDTHNPHAQQVLLANLLGAASRGHWQATDADLAEVAGRLTRSAAAHGIVCEANVCRNPALTAYVEQSLTGAPGREQLMAGYRSALDRAVVVPPADATPAPSASAAAARAPAPAMAPRAAAPPRPSPIEPKAQVSPPVVATPPMVTGRAMEDVINASPRGEAANGTATLWAIGALAALLFAAGWALPARAAR